MKKQKKTFKELYAIAKGKQSGCCRIDAKEDTAYNSNESNNSCCCSKGTNKSS